MGCSIIRKSIIGRHLATIMLRHAPDWGNKLPHYATDSTGGAILMASALFTH